MELRSVLVVHNYYTQVGGEDGVFEAEKTLLSRNGFDVYDYTRHNSEIQTLGVLRSITSLVWAHDSLQGLRNIIRAKKPDIVHFHNTFLLISPASYYACQREGIPVVQTLHNYRLLCPAATFLRDGKLCEECLGKIIPWPGILYGCWRGSRVLSAAVATMLTIHRLLGTWHNKVDIFIALTEFARMKFIEGGIPPDKIVVKPNFIDPDPGLSEHSKKYAIFVGRLSPEKGICTLLDALKKVRAIPVKIVGTGPMLEELQDFKQGNHLDQLEVLGRVSHDKVIELMRNANFLLFPSEWYEGFPLTIVEAFACGLPVIASRLGAMNEIVEDGSFGLHFDPGRASDLAEKMIWAWEHPNEMREMGLKARMEYKEKYHSKQNYRTLVEIYRRASESNSYE